VEETVGMGWDGKWGWEIEIGILRAEKKREEKI
jgi:hypothetical protein